MITCLVADDHPAVLKALAQVLSEEGFEVVATAERGDEALAKLEEKKPDVAVLDARMPGLSGIEVAREAESRSIGTAIVFYTGANDTGLLADAASLGVRGFVLKDAPLGELVHALYTVAGGGSYVDGALAAPLVSGAAAASLPGLTPREREVLADLAEGRTYDEIGRHLSISPATARVHVQKAMRRLDANTKTQAVAVALRRSLIE